MRPYLLKGHERPLTQLKYGPMLLFCKTSNIARDGLSCWEHQRTCHCIALCTATPSMDLCDDRRYNREGDLLFSCAKVVRSYNPLIISMFNSDDASLLHSMDGAS